MEKKIIKCEHCGKEIKTEQEIKYKICINCAWEENV